jgi:hypothetical protein
MEDNELRLDLISLPEKLTSSHQVEGFDSGIETLNNWLKHRAFGNEIEGASQIAGIRAILVHAISEEAKLFYEKYHFTASTLEPMTLMAKIQDLAISFGMPTSDD